MGLCIVLVGHLLSEDRIKKVKKTGDSRYIYQNELDKAFFQYDMAYWDFKDLQRRTKKLIIKIKY